MHGKRVFLSEIFFLKKMPRGRVGRSGGGGRRFGGGGGRSSITRRFVGRGGGYSPRGSGWRGSVVRRGGLRRPGRRNWTRHFVGGGGGGGGQWSSSQWWRRRRWPAAYTQRYYRYYGYPYALSRNYYTYPYQVIPYANYYDDDYYFYSEPESEPSLAAAVNPVRVVTDSSALNADEWASQPNKAVHQGGPNAPPTLLYCASGRPTLVNSNAVATPQRPVLAIDNQLYQCQ